MTKTLTPTGTLAWILLVVYADVVVFGRTERLTSDLMSLAIVAALKNARFPKIEVTNAEEDEFDIDHAAPQQCALVRRSLRLEARLP